MVKDIVQKTVIRLESTEVGLIQLFSWILFLGMSRYILEDLLFLREFKERNHFQYGIYLILFYLIVFLFSSVIIKIYSGENVKKVVNSMIFLFSLVLVIPIIDYFFVVDPKPYRLVSYGKTVLDCIKEYPGITLTGLFMMFLGSVYVTVKKGVLRGGLSFLTLFGVYYYIFASRLLEDLRNWILSFGIPEVLPEELVRDIWQRSFNLIYIFIVIILLLPFLYYYNKEFFQKLLIRMRWERGIQYLLILFYAFTMVGDWHPFRIFILFFNCLAIYLIWLGSVLVNDFYDLESDMINGAHRNTSMPLTKEEMVQGISIVWGLALLIGAQITSSVFYMNLAIIAITYFYSAPPIRFKRYLLSSLFIGFSAFYLVLIGVFANINFFYYSDKVFYVALLFGLSLAAGANVVDFKDYVGDEKVGVRTLVTVFGLSRAKKIVALLTGVSYIIIGIVLARIMKSPLYYASILPALVMPYMILHFKNTKWWWKLYFFFHMIVLFQGGFDQYIFCLLSFDC